MKSARTTPSAHRRSPQRAAKKVGRVSPATPRPLPRAARKSLSPVRAARSAYVNAFCAFLHSPAQ